MPPTGTEAGYVTRTGVFLHGVVLPSQWNLSGWPRLLSDSEARTLPTAMARAQPERPPSATARKIY